MHLTQYSDYAMRVLMYLAMHPGETVTISRISEEFGISKEHLRKVVHQLSGLGYINTSRGKKGGMRLAMEPQRIRIGDVVRRTETHFNVVECFDAKHNRCILIRECGLQGALQEAVSSFLSALDRYTLADVITR